MKKNILQLCLLLTFGAGNIFALGAFNTQKTSPQKARDLAEWTIVAYLQADNNLAPYANYNINDMQRVGSSKSVNMLVQWDQPKNNKTWRYYIEKGKRTDAGSLDKEMGINPEQELIDMMKWASTNYPAKRYMMILWNHGNGVSDRKIKNGKELNPLAGWIQVPGSNNTPRKDRGILYDDSQSTFLTNQALTRVCKSVKTILGKNIDIVGMDACMMAMVEVAHNLRNNVDMLVGSQETEPGEGWPYSAFLAALSEKPSLFGAQELANTIVLAYDNFYKGDITHTQSATFINKIDPIGKTLDNVVTEIKKCHKENAADTIKLLQTARKNSIEFSVADYIDLHSFYTALIDQVKKTRSSDDTRDHKRSSDSTRALSKLALGRLETVVGTAQKALLEAVSSSLVGSQYAKAKGLSIYYPKGNALDKTYAKTSFASETQWLSCLKLLGKI